MKNILFVCVGNSCRSPIAEHLAKKYFADKIIVCSGGTSVNRSYSNDMTIKLMKEHYAIDLSKHIPKPYREYDLKTFDHIIALSGDVWETVVWSNPPYPDRVVRWDIEDPFGKDYDEYVKCAKEIDEKVINSLKYYLG
jgi:protein-tyrosine-phosphatase